MNPDSKQVRSIYKSIKDIVFSALLEDILNGTIQSGEKLSTAGLSEKYGVSRTPVREAITQLCSSGLAENLPHKGAFVKTVSIPDIIEIYYIRGSLSGVAARLALPNLDKAEIQVMQDYCCEMEKMIKQGNYEEVLRLNDLFHQSINSAANSPRLEKLLDQFYVMSSFYRTLGLRIPGRDELVCREHKAIVDALASGNPDLVEESVRVHYFNTARCIAESAGTR